MEGYKTSKYNTVHETNYGLILFNTYSCGLLKITDEEVKTLNSINETEVITLLAAKNPDYNKVLIDHGFLVKNDVDEFALVKSRLYRSKYGTTGAGITINTGLACNCRCTYCYEGQEHSSTSVMTPEKAGDIISFIKDKFPPTIKLRLSFLGGEPLLCFEEIKRIYYELKNIFEYLSLSVTTNGVLIDEDVAKFFKETKASVQVSIDGVKHHHNKKRIDKKGNGTYDKIIENVKISQNAGVPVSVRTHVDKEFMDNVNLQEWIESIKTNFDLTKSINFYIAQIFSSGKGAKAADEKFIDYMTTIYVTFIENSIPFKFDYAFNPMGSCFVANENSLSINCKGEFYKCWHDVSADDFNGRHFGNIYDGINWAKLISYTNSLDVLENAECRDCVYLPVCSGGCPEYVMAGTNKCTPLKHYPEKMIALFMRYKGYSLEP
ncbi:MAG: radical SAM protein [Treponema sp.]|nr:radical SAM protein [Treponema sp.]